MLEGIERVTDKVRAVERPELDPGQAAAARRSAMAALEQECSERSGLRCDMITLYQGGEYDLYQFRKFTDVRLVFAPEAQLAQFGGDADNFEYPRWSMDFSLFRVYVDGKPYRAAALPQVERERGQGGRGHLPGRQPRLDRPSADHGPARVAARRGLPGDARLARLQRARLYEYAARGPEQDRVAKEYIDGVENSIKATSGFLSGLLDPALLAKKAAEEKSLRDAVAKDPGARGQGGRSLEGDREGAGGGEEPVRPLAGDRSRARRREHARQLRAHADPARRREGEAERRAAARVPGHGAAAGLPAPGLDRSGLPRLRGLPARRSAPSRGHPARAGASGHPARARRLHSRGGGGEGDRRHAARRPGGAQGARRRWQGGARRRQGPADRPHAGVRAALARDARAAATARSKASPASPARRSPRPSSRSTAATSTPTRPSRCG